MGGGRRKITKRAPSREEGVSLQDGQSIVQVTSLRGSNIIEVMDAEGVTSLALFPAKFQKCIWIKRGSFVIVDGNERDRAIESGNKITYMVAQVLFHEQIRHFQNSPNWPAIFKPKATNDSNIKQHQSGIANGGVQEQPNLENSDEEDDLPPLEANINRNRPIELYSDPEAESD